MGMVTMQQLEQIEKYLNALNEEQLDRIITAQDWCANLVVSSSGERCLVGHAHNYSRNEDGSYRIGEHIPYDLLLLTPPNTFDYMVHCTGLDNTVSYVKSLAARIVAEKFPLRVPSAPTVEQMEEVGA